jgi:hypothetical protein
MLLNDAKHGGQSEAGALRPRIITAASAIPATGKMGETLPGGIVIKKLTLATTAYMMATAEMATGGELRIRGREYSGVPV